MLRLFRMALGLQLLAVSPLMAQQSTWRIRGDTTGAPRGCSAAAGIAAITAWFAAFHAADSAGLVRATGIDRGRFTFTTGKFAAGDTFVRIHTLPELLRYARARALRHERMTLEAVRFYGWRRRDFGFMPYFVRSADDLGPKGLAGIGKGGYSCDRGISVLNLAPRPAMDPGFDR
jgi:hypothetical protein